MMDVMDDFDFDFRRSIFELNLILIMCPSIVHRSNQQLNTENYLSEEECRARNMP